ncbi:MarR family winged helix-turn-helix transcriptional regulator [Bradyrhizobium sp. Arg237L]|uniref:MarR family winged helix-turn-helix transcriptional regulator n=1 Tax=Bradyrhizobium sp. Arg237L TaxID=3003352 RepID=UPI00249E870E|nr:MarR family winged helix-turn-helix transcriptional regulator [Bradyrhizobium sp. Arg237L]MDI4236500.1 MarR family winged helix-turn-helix transcriptional regulator [Bradyrhizobium sp. Arg237L]
MPSNPRGRKTKHVQNRQNREVVPSQRPEKKYDFYAQVGYLLRRVFQRHTAIFQRMSIDPQLTAIQFVVLCVIAENSPCFLTTISRSAALDPATTRGVVERLSKRNLITITPDKVDRRRVAAELKEKGRRLVEEMIPCSLRITEATMFGLNAAERVALQFLLTKIIESGDPDEIEDASLFDFKRR